MAARPRTPLTRLEVELLADLFEVERAFLAGEVTEGTIQSKVLFRMAHRRGRTRPAPAHGLVQTDRFFLSVFSRTLNRLFQRELVQRRSVRDTVKTLPYQWGFAHHDRKERELLLTEEGRRVGAGLAEQRGRQQEPVAPPLEIAGADRPADAAPPPLPPAVFPPPGAGMFPALVATPGAIPVQVVSRFSPLPGIEYLYVEQVKAKQLVHRQLVTAGPFAVEYIYVRDPQP